jgi:hypothetical protein
MVENGGVARGWESKSVESQQEAAEARAAERPPLTGAQQQLAALEHTRTRLRNEIEPSSNSRFRDLKGKALAHVEELIRLCLAKSGT